MKKMSLLLTFMFTVIMSFTANPYQKMVVEGKTWNCIVISANPKVLPYDMSYFIKGDTLIGGKSCKKMYVSYMGNNGAVQYSSAWYEEGEKVYCIYGGETNVTLMFDFAMNTGDSINPIDFFEEPNVTVTRIDTLMLHDVARRTLFFSNYICPWIDGIGGTLGPETPKFGIGAAPVLISCTQGNDVLYEEKDYKKLDWYYDYRDYDYFLEQGKTLFTFCQSTPDYLIVTKMLNDTVCSGKPYMKIEQYCLYLKDCPVPEMAGTKYNDQYFLAREERGKIYTRSLDKDDEGLLYDLTKSVGEKYVSDKIKFNFKTDSTILANMEVKSRDSVVCNDGEKHMKCTFVGSNYVPLQNKTEDYTYSFLEGVGDVTNGFFDSQVTYYGTSGWAVSHLGLCVDGNGKVLYKADDWDAISARILGIKSVTAKMQGIENGAMYDLSGRRLQVEPEHGIFIKNGQKIAK